ESKLTNGTALVLGVRPEHLSLVATPGSIGLPIKVNEVEQLGGHCLIYGTLPDAGVRITAQCEGQQPTRIGDRITLYAEPLTSHLFAAEEHGSVVQ
ncbi:MAG: TOBE domain-containing protein, partial [Propionivibrio sp.]